MVWVEGRVIDDGSRALNCDLSRLLGFHAVQHDGEDTMTTASLGAITIDTTR
jgi:hypothetical protein